MAAFDPRELPDEVMLAAGIGGRAQDLQLIEQWLARGGNINARCSSRSGFTLLLAAVFELNPSLTQFLLARGADPNMTSLSLITGGLRTLHVFVISALCNRRNELEEREALDMLKLLIRSGAQIEARDSKGDTPLARALGNSSNHLTSVRLGFLAELLRAGANIDKCCLRDNVPAPFETLWQNRETCEQTDPSFVAAKAFMNEVRAAGSYRKWRRLPHKSVARLRSLVVRGRATTSDPALAFILRLGDNGLFWKCLEFWPGRAVVY